MSKVVYFPIYNIHSPLVKAALGMKDPRSVERWMREAGITIKEIGGKKMISCEDLIEATKKKDNSSLTYSISQETSDILKDLK